MTPALATIAALRVAASASYDASAALHHDAIAAQLHDAIALRLADAADVLAADAPAPDAAPEPDDPAGALAGEPTTTTDTGFAADQLVAEPVPDPVATHPAGLDPHTLCPTTGCPRPPLGAAITLGAALLDYDNHPSRTGGDELSARFDLWRGLGWAAHATYLVDTIDAGTATTAIHDLALGAQVALPTERTAWVAATAHVLDGGGAVWAAIGAQFAGFDVEVSGSAMQLDADRAAHGGIRIGRQGAHVDGWIAGDAGSSTLASVELGGGGGLALHGGAWSLAVEGLVGDRALAVTERGEVAEAVAETFHTTGRALLGVALGSHVAPYLGVAARTATASSAEYTQVVGFAGISFRF